MADSTGSEAEPESAGPLSGVRAVARGQIEGTEASEALDSAWRELEGMEGEGESLVRSELRRALDGPGEAPFFLLDSASYLVRHGRPGDDEELAIEALLAVDPRNPVVELASIDVFRLLHLLGTRRDERVMALVDRLILPFDRPAAIPEHAMFEVPAWVQAAWVYGLFGVAGEEHVQTLLADAESDRGRLYRVLQWIGSEASVVPAQRAFVRAPADEATTDSYMRYLLTVGGHAESRSRRRGLRRHRRAPFATRSPPPSRSSGTRSGACARARPHHSRRRRRVSFSRSCNGYAATPP